MHHVLYITTTRNRFHSIIVSDERLVRLMLRRDVELISYKELKEEMK